MYVDRGDYGRAIPLLVVASRLAPGDDRHLNNLAQAYLRAGDMARARALAGEGVARFGEMPKFHHLLALASLGDDPETTVREAQRALALDPSYEPSRQLVRWLTTEHPQRAWFAQRFSAVAPAR